MHAPSSVRELVTHLPNGTLTLATDADADSYCAVAARANPRRGFLIVSKVLGRHLPARPHEMRRVMQAMAAQIPADVPTPLVFLGMAETATALGQGCFAAWRAMHPDTPACYLQSSRQSVVGADAIARFEEGHSHATSHLVQVRDDKVRAIVASARTLIIVDDECSTGATFVSAATAMAAAMPELARIETLCITDWSDGAYRNALPVPGMARSVIGGRLHWAASANSPSQSLPRSSNAAGAAPASGMGSRTGLLMPEAATHATVIAQPGERVLVLGEGEHSYEALLVAEEIERAGGIAAVQCITRSPALLGHAMQSISHFTDSYGSGAPCFLYNILAHAPDRIVIVSEIAGNQRTEAKAALAELGAAIPVDLVLCTYQPEAGQ